LLGDVGPPSYGVHAFEERVSLPLPLLVEMDWYDRRDGLTVALDDVVAAVVRDLVEHLAKPAASISSLHRAFHPGHHPGFRRYGDYLTPGGRTAVSAAAPR